jgi:hypothetical protein
MYGASVTPSGFDGVCHRRLHFRFDTGSISPLLGRRSKIEYRSAVWLRPRSAVAGILDSTTPNWSPGGTAHARQVRQDFVRGSLRRFSMNSAEKRPHMRRSAARSSAPASRGPSPCRSSATRRSRSIGATRSWTKPCNAKRRLVSTPSRPRRRPATRPARFATFTPKARARVRRTAQNGISRAFRPSLDDHGTPQLREPGKIR